PAPKSAQVQPPSGGNSGSGDDRPILHRGSSQPAPTPTPPQAGPPSAPPSEQEPEPQDPNRPVLRRHKPAPEAAPAPTPTPSAKASGPPSSRQDWTVWILGLRFLLRGR